MRHAPIDPELFVENRRRLASLLPPKSIAVVNANDVLPTNADGSLPLVPNSDLFYLTGVEQEESILVLAPDAFDERMREILFLREPNERLEMWEGRKLTPSETRRATGVQRVAWLSEFPSMLHQWMCDAENVFLNTNEHKRADIRVETRDARFVADVQRRYPLHNYRRLAPALYYLRRVKSPIEIDLIRQAIEITDHGFRRVLSFVRPGVNECEVEAEFVHEFTRRRGKFAYSPIVASGKNACVLHYVANDQPCREGDLLLLDVAASYANYSSDLTRTIPVSGRFTARQRAVYDAVLRVLRASIAGATVGKLDRQWQREAQLMMNDEMLALGLITSEDIDKQTPDRLACRKYFPHGLGHSLGLDVHDVGDMSIPFEAGMVLTVEPGIYIPEEGLAVRLENDILLTNEGPIDLMANIPLEADEIERQMAGG